MAFFTITLAVRSVPVDYRGSTNSTALTDMFSIEVVHSLLHIQFCKGTHNADENKIELSNEMTLRSAFYSNKSNVLH